MADTASIATALDDRVRFIYEPVERQLARVVDNLRGLAAGANLAGDAALLEYAVVSGGKKVRPVVTLLAGGSREGHEDELVTMATAVELLHIATLIHDDTVDKAATRRGRATVSSLWGNDVAVLLGDYVFAASATFVCDTRDLRVVRRFSETIMELARGELAERASSHDWSQTVDDYFQRIYNKTASLFCTAAQAGGLLSQAPEEEAAALTRYGYYLGLAFQIMDDVARFPGDRGGAWQARRRRPASGRHHAPCLALRGPPHRRARRRPATAGRERRRRPRPARRAGARVLGHR